MVVIATLPTKHNTTTSCKQCNISLHPSNHYPQRHSYCGKVRRDARLVRPVLNQFLRKSITSINFNNGMYMIGHYHQ